MTRLSLVLFGGFQGRIEPGPSLSLPTKKAQALLGYLALPLGRKHPRDKLAALLWGDMPEAQARNSLRQALFAVRKALAAVPVLRIEGETLALDAAAVDVDVTAFERLVAEGTPDTLARAAGLYEGDLLAGLVVKEAPFEEWLMAERERLRELALEALARLLAHQRKAGAAEAAIKTALRLLALDPLQEDVRRTLMRLYAELGRRGAALRQYPLCVGVLQRELGTEPETETKQLYQEILRQRPARVLTAGKPSGGPVGLPVRGAARARPEVPAAETPLVGREPEIGRLREALARAWAGHGQVAVVLGEAGIGKSRLIAELVGDAVERGGHVLLGGGHESDQILPFGPWVDCFRTGQVTQDLEVLQSLGPVWRAELARLLPDLEVPGSEPVTGTGDYLRLFESIAKLLAHLAARSPLVLILEDLHWADDMSLRLLAFLGRRVEAWPVLVVATAREEELTDAPSFRRALEDLGRARLVRLTLAPLSRADTMALVRALTRTGTDEAAVARLETQVWIASEGNPFIVVETMRALRDGAAPDASGSLPLPQRVGEVLARRLERVSDKSQPLVAVAAVIGREFDFPLLQRAADVDEREAAECMEELVRRRLLHGVGERFDFTHDRIRELAYSRLLPLRRKLLHRRVGEALEALHTDRLEEVYGPLAYHYSKAENLEKAIVYLAHFGKQAARRHSHSEAVSAFRDALAHAERLAGRAPDPFLLDLVLRQVQSLNFLGRNQESLDLLLRERERVKRLKESALISRYHFALALNHTFVGDQERAAESVQLALEEAKRCRDERIMGRAHALLALLSYWSGRPAQGLEHSHEAVALLERTRQPYWLGYAYFYLALNYHLLGEIESALAAMARARGVGERIGNRDVQSYAAWGSGVIYALAGEWKAGVDACQRGVELSPDPLTRALASAALGYAYLEKGEGSEAIPLLEQAVQRMSQFRWRQLQSWFTACLSEALCVDGQIEKARELALQGLGIGRDAGFGYAIGISQRALGRIAQARGALTEAESFLNEALQTFGSMQARLEAGLTHLALAELTHTRANREAVASHLKEAHRQLTVLRVPKQVERTEQLARKFGLSFSSEG